MALNQENEPFSENSLPTKKFVWGPIGKRNDLRSIQTTKKKCRDYNFNINVIGKNEPYRKE